MTNFHDKDGLPIEPEPYLKAFVSRLGGQGSPNSVTYTGDKTYEIHDSGSKAVYDDGMQRDNTAGKPRFDLIFPRDIPYEDQLLTRVAMQYEVGGQKYGPRNWEKSSSEESLAHHESALMRHVVKFLTGTEDGEDHAAAIVWNTNAIDLTRRNIRNNTALEAEIEEYAGGEAGGAGGGDTTDALYGFRRYNPSTGEYDSLAEAISSERFEAENEAAKLLLMGDLVFDDGASLTDCEGDTWYYSSAHDDWACGDMARDEICIDQDDGLASNRLLGTWGPLTLTSGYRNGWTISRDGKVTRT